MKSLRDARLHILVAIGIPLLGYMFSKCWNADGPNYYSVPSDYPFCTQFDHVSAFGVDATQMADRGSGLRNSCVDLSNLERTKFKLRHYPRWVVSQFD